MKRKIVAALAFAGVVGFSVLAFAAGLFPDYPVVGGATYCAGTSSSATGTIIGLVTGCPNQVPAGPTILTGSEQIPADTRLASGANPQTVLVPMAALNALPITFSSLTAVNASNSLTATNTTGGFAIISTAALSPTTVWLPSAPIDGQQFTLSSNATIATLAVTPANGSGQIMSIPPTALTTSASVAYNYRFIYHTATSTWYRLQ